MFYGTQGQNPLVPLILRLVLGAIFIYHGAEKVIGPKNDLGASWARNVREDRGKTPKDVLDKVDGLRVSAENKRIIKGELNTAYNRAAPTLPADLKTFAIQLAIAWGELAAGVALVIGFLTRVAAVGMIIVQIGAIAMVTWDVGFSVEEGGGFEFNLALLAMCLALVLTGGGVFSVDACLWGQRKRPQAVVPAGTA
jgi:uncharacterized membrane protein YphA (DoxX/SURF4 family)